MLSNRITGEPQTERHIRSAAGWLSLRQAGVRHARGQKQWVSESASFGVGVGGLARLCHTAGNHCVRATGAELPKLPGLRHLNLMHCCSVSDAGLQVPLSPSMQPGFACMQRRCGKVSCAVNNWAPLIVFS